MSKILVVGANGMIGSTIFRTLSKQHVLHVCGSVRSSACVHAFPEPVRDQLFVGLDARDFSKFRSFISELEPSLVVNCVGVTKHVEEGKDSKTAIAVNSLFPHQLAEICSAISARLIHISTDCVFSGNRGNYDESDEPDSIDLYGKSKALGEIFGENALTIRTSTIGPELESNNGLLEWFLKQRDHCRGFSNAIFSGLPTVTLSEIIRDVIIPTPWLKGLYHVGGASITKFDLLNLIADVYRIQIDIRNDSRLIIDRSLNSSRFEVATGYRAPDWESLIFAMHENHRGVTHA